MFHEGLVINPELFLDRSGIYDENLNNHRCGDTDNHRLFHPTNVGATL